MGTSPLKIRIENYVRKERTQIIRIHPFKEKEGDEGRSQLGWPMEGEGKGSHAWWLIEENEKHLFTPSHFPPKKLYLDFHFFL